MEISQLQYLINSGEGNRIEFKEANNSVPSSLYETVVSFSNTDGGTILLGVTDNGSITGISSGAEFSLIKNIITSLNSRDCIDPPLFVEPLLVTHPQGRIIILHIPASSQIHNHSGRIFVRHFESDLDITHDQHRLSDIYIRKRNFFTEGIIYPRLSMDDLDDALFEKAFTLIRNNKSDHPWLFRSKEELLREAILWRRDFQTGQEGLTLAAALIFGKNETIQSILPAYKTEGLVRKQNKDHYDDRIIPPLRTNLIDTYLELKKFISKHLPEMFFLEGDQRVDLRDRIFREVIGNAVVHREYTSALSTELLITEQEVVITNPNKPHLHGVIDPNGFNPYPKNPNIRKFFTAFGWTDEIGSGIRNTNKYLPQYVKGAHPVFIDDDIFRVILPLRFVSLAKYTAEFTRWLDLKTDFPPARWEGLKQVELPSEFWNRTWEEALIHLVPGWHKAGTGLAPLNWAEKQLFAEDDLKKIPGWHEKGTQLLKKKNWYLISILSICTAPVKMADLLAAFDYKNAKKFRDNYLRPLKDTGLIAFTIPEKPTDPDNKYLITQKGKIFLATRLL